MKRLLKLTANKNFARLSGRHTLAKQVTGAAASKKTVFALENMEITPPRTADDIRRAFAEGRIAEMTPEQAGDTTEP